MRPEVARDMSDSRDDFVRVVWPAISAWCGGGRVISCEGPAASEIAAALDQYAGIDYLHIRPDSGVRGIASRVQFGGAYSSFTVRSFRRTGARTELAKRLASDDGWIKSALTAQAYLNCRGGALLDVGLTQTHDLYEYLANGGEADEQVNPQDGNLFLVVWWASLRRAGYRVRSLRPVSAVRPVAQPEPWELALPTLEQAQDYTATGTFTPDDEGWRS